MTDPKDLRGELAFTTGDVMALSQLLQAIRRPLLDVFDDVYVETACIHLAHRDGYSVGVIDFDSSETGLRFFPMTKEQKL